MQTAINLCKAGELLKSTAKKTGSAAPITYLKDMDSVFFGPTRDKFKHLAFIYAKKNYLNYSKNGKYEKARDDWLASFLSRHKKISLRTPEATSVAIAKVSTDVKWDFFMNIMKL